MEVVPGSRLSLESPVAPVMFSINDDLPAAVLPITSITGALFVASLHIISNHTAWQTCLNIPSSN